MKWPRKGSVFCCGRSRYDLWGWECWVWGTWGHWFYRGTASRTSSGGMVFAWAPGSILKVIIFCHSLWGVADECRMTPGHLELSLSTGSLLDAKRFLQCQSVQRLGWSLCCPRCTRRGYISNKIASYWWGEALQEGLWEVLWDLPWLGEWQHEHLVGALLEQYLLSLWCLDVLSLGNLPALLGLLV